MDTAKLQEVIVTDIKRRGNGKDDPIRIITQYWSKDGELLAEVDPLPDGGKYNELLMCVAEKIPGESRHQTALRQLQHANAPSTTASCENVETRQPACEAQSSGEFLDLAGWFTGCLRRLVLIS